ncbi:F-box domain [Arabidopsis suecica]|uniref:F-box domain n=1 Tax=Arabidopsis suecica TaxID=45249 RepID=A0A8T1YFG9_ARASU|nr:F-box domain [Arabidopsis suecica]
MSNSGADEEPPRTKKLKLYSSPSTSEFFSLPYEIVLSCLARVPRSDYAYLSLASKCLRSIVVSPEIYDVRSLIGCTDSCIYLCLRIPPNLTPSWFCFFPKTLNRPRRLVPIRTHLYQPQEASTVVALGCGIYVIGGTINGRHTSSVFFLDCRSHTWSILPSMRVARASAAAGVVDGKIYVLGGCGDFESKPRKWGEVFDPKTQTWDDLPMPPSNQYNLNFPLMFESAVMEEKVFALNGAGRCMFYIPSEGIWKTGNSDTCRDRRGWYMIDNVMYCCETRGRILWCEAGELDWRQHEGMVWREVMGLKTLTDTLCASKLVNYGGRMLNHRESCKKKRVRHGWRSDELDKFLPGHKLSNYGPNMLLFWDVLGHEKLEIWCAEISLKRRKEGVEIYGKIEWSEAVLTFKPPPLHQHHCKLLYSLPHNL